MKEKELTPEDVVGQIQGFILSHMRNNQGKYPDNALQIVKQYGAQQREQGRLESEIKN